MASEGWTTYVTTDAKGYKIEQTPLGHWKIRGWYHKMPGRLKGTFSTFIKAERALIAYLRSNDKTEEAIYPGCLEHKSKRYLDCLERRLQNYTGRSLRA